MELEVEVVSIGLAIASLALALYAIHRLRGIEAIALRRLERKQGKRIKRYVLVKIVCREDVDARSLREKLLKAIADAMGPALRSWCSVDLVALRLDRARAIVRVRGAPICVDAVLAILSVLHLRGFECVVAPIRTSGLLTRLERYLKR